jgi:SAM-dependent methyltransferase
MEARTGFDHVYDQPDPRGYFRALGPFGYQTPHHAQEVFRRLVAALTPSNVGRRVTVLDICCSYGINAALLNHDLTLADLQARYTGPDTTTLSVKELLNADRVFYAAHRHPTGQLARVVGLDPARNAIDYARAVGLVDAGFAENLETTPANAALLAAVRDVRLITVTGGASFLSPRTFQPLLDNAERPVWVAAFVLRTGSYQPIVDALAGYGLVTETSTRTFPQRRFTSPAEQRYAIDAVIATGHDPSGKETEGAFHTTLHLSRPPTDIAAFPLTALLPDG